MIPYNFLYRLCNTITFLQVILDNLKRLPNNKLFSGWALKTNYISWLKIKLKLRY